MAPAEEKRPLLKILGRLGSAEGYTLRDFLHRSDVPFEWVVLSSDEDARRRAGVTGLRDSRLPVCVFTDGTRLECPTIRQITEKLGWFATPSRSEYDLAIYGAGAAGLSAAVYGASEGLKTIVIERWTPGGQAGSSSNIENYLGFPNGISGNDLADRARKQATKFGAELLIARETVRAQLAPGTGVGILEDGTKVVARASICATGMEYRRLGLPREDQFLGAGLYYGAGASEAPWTNGEHVYVVGGGNSAAQAAMHFARYASRVTMVVREDSLSSTVSQYLVDRIHSTSNVDLLTESRITQLHGDDTLSGIVLTHDKTGEQRSVSTHWVFVCIGGVPHTQWAAEVGLERDDLGYLVTGPDLQRVGGRPPSWPLDREPYYLETNLPGVFAAGDVRHNSVKRVASAVGEGAMAVTFVHRHLSNR